MIASTALVTALAVAGSMLQQRRDAFLARVEKHVELEGLCRKIADRSQSTLEWSVTQIKNLESDLSHDPPEAARKPAETLLKALRSNEPKLREEVRLMESERKHHAAMADKYRHAASYPWLPVQPDPPLPSP